MDEKTMHKLSYGLFVLTAREGEKDNGCIINTAMQVTSNPNRLSLAVNKNNLTHDMILNTKKLAVSVISEAATMQLFSRFGFQSGRDVDKFADYAQMKRTDSGLYYVTEATNGYFAGTVSYYMDLGTHTLFTVEVEEMETLSDQPSATYQYYHQNIKPKPQTADEDNGKKKWRCTVCGYVYEGDELPADYVCPLCKHPASDFEPVV